MYLGSWVYSASQVTLNTASGRVYWTYATHARKTAADLKVRSEKNQLRQVCGVPDRRACLIYLRALAFRLELHAMVWHFRSSVTPPVCTVS
jgi:hypothetical protein